MARSFDNANSEYLRIGSAPLTAVPITMAAWIYPSSQSNSSTIMHLNNSSNNVNRFLLDYLPTATNDPVRASVQSSSGTRDSRVTSQISFNSWNHVAAVFSSATVRRVWCNGVEGDGDDDGGSITPSGIDEFSVARLDWTTPTNYYSGRIAEAAMWSAALNDDELASLNLGACPLLVRPGSLTAYWPLGGAYSASDADTDALGGFDLTPFNTPSTADHPSMIYPATPQLAFGRAAPEADGFTPRLALLGAG